MMVVKTISLNLPEELIKESSRHSTSLEMTRSEYIRKAIERMNREVETQFRASRLRKAAAKCSEADREVNAEFASVEPDVQD